MKFDKLKLEGALVINIDEIDDERGFFARVYSYDEYKNNGMQKSIVQINDSWTKSRATLRGIHYQLHPKREGKLIRCIRGRIWDLIIDLRNDSETFGQWFGIELSAQNRQMIYAPEGFGHGFISLENDCEILYAVTEYYSPEQERILRWNDPKFNIEWPIEPSVILDKDNNAPDFDYSYHLGVSGIK